MKILSEVDIETIAKPKQWVDTMELALKSAADIAYFTPKRMHLDMEDNTLLLMPSTGPDMFATKLVSVFPANKSIGKPIIQGTVLLNDGKTGESLALLNGSKLTAMRTAAVAIVGARHLNSKTNPSIGIVGAGIQGSHIAWMASDELKSKSIFVYDRSEEVINEFNEFLSQKNPLIKVVVCGSVEELLQHSDIIFTATTSQKPVLPNKKDLLMGKIFIGVGSYKPDTREFPVVLYDLIDRIWIDADHGVKESGDLIFPLENGMIGRSEVKNISLLISGKEKKSNATTHLYKTVGLGIFDLFAAQLVYEKAESMKLGLSVEI